MQLYDYLLFRSFAIWAWGGAESDEVSPELCLEGFPFFTGSCLTTLLIKGIGIAIILGACLNKAPILINVLKTGSVAGLSTNAVYGEVIMYCNSAFYGILRGNPFTAYGENAVVALQTAIMATLIWKYRDPVVTMPQRIAAVAGFATYTFVVFKVLTPEQYPYLVTSNLPVLIYSRGSQIIETFRLKQTGSNSLITTAMNLLGSVIRIVTTISEIGWDMALLYGYFTSAALNIILVLQFVLYKDNTAKFLESLQKKD
mmetsp:Transcript_14030/g.30479  ORF Transcript_14030/g.30479 Transcript_14030/m.30479 type:complete len:257 (+) Transcript_14030:105-875(+)|eukprot:CAMPEP_0178522928 /NCGR_PEP_ID=MMETSP0696-20121128/28806_1 /TAXON_ID=265572 /ORGANISM="Extubocellulus spinifer, Strain CCMP396" /LENGTH=256 /DNA_ID=CAMNT_0020154099 /DNA_START=38 /DNA_END=808 /DNA_ORIENTATION=-